MSTSCLSPSANRSFIHAVSVVGAAAVAACLLSPVGANADLITISPGILNPANGSTYFLLESSGWTAAEAKAQSMGGHLATVRNQSEQDWLVATFSNYGGLDRFLWIGLNDAAQEGTWVWSSGEPVTYTHWWTWEPNSNIPEEDYVQMFGVKNFQDIPAGYWNDIYDDPWPYKEFTHGFGPVYGVAEIMPVPELGETGLLGGFFCLLMIAFDRLQRLRCRAE